MAFPQTIPTGIGVPNELPVTITQGVSGIDLTTVTAVTLNVLRTQDGTTATWVCSIAPGATVEQLTALYAFTGVEVTITGIYQVYPTLTVPGGVVPCTSFEFLAVSPYKNPMRV